MHQNSPLSEIDYINLKTNQLIETFPLSSEFIFSNVYATYKGDKRACEQEYYNTFDKKAVPFPSNEQMVFDAGQDLKNQLKSLIAKNKFRR